MTPQAVIAYLALHFHLSLISRRVTRIEKTPTVRAELAAMLRRITPKES